MALRRASHSNKPDQPQSTGMSDFKMVKKIGEGAFSMVYRVIRVSDNIEYALKQVKMAKLTEKEKQNALNEVRILASIQNENVIAYKEAFFDESSSTLCIVMEFADGGDLYQKILEHQKKGTFFTEKEIWNIIGQMVKGLKALHDMNILHRDLKCANIFLNRDGTVKMGDLNVSKVAKYGGLLFTQTGTPYYASPEVWKDQPYDLKSDIWSLGCVVYEMTSLQPPFKAQNMDQLYKKVLSGQYPSIPSMYSSDLSQIIGSLLQVIPQKRPSCEQILSHSKLQYISKQQSFHEPQGQNMENVDLLKTIQMPLNLNQLSKILPKSKYNKGIERSESNKKYPPYYDKSSSQDISLPPLREIESVQSDRKSKLSLPQNNQAVRALSRESSQESLIQLKTRRILQQQQQTRRGNQKPTSLQEQAYIAPGGGGDYSTRNHHRPLIKDPFQTPQVERPPNLNEITPQLLQRQYSQKRDLVAPQRNQYEQLAGMIRGQSNVMSAKELRHKYYAPIEQVRKDLSEMSQQYNRQHQDSILQAIDGGKRRNHNSQIVQEEFISQITRNNNNNNNNNRGNSNQRNIQPYSYDSKVVIDNQQSNNIIQSNPNINVLAQKRYSEIQSQGNKPVLQQLMPDTPKYNRYNNQPNQDPSMQKGRRLAINDENFGPTQIRNSKQQQQISSIQDETELLKRMHKQANINSRQAPPLKSNYRRRAGANYDPLDQYKPANQQIGALKLNLDNDIIQTERGNGAGGRQIPISGSNNGAITNRNYNQAQQYNGLRLRKQVPF